MSSMARALVVGDDGSLGRFRLTTAAAVVSLPLTASVLPTMHVPPSPS